MQLGLFALFLSTIGITEAYLCYQCSYDKLYNLNQAWNKKECMVNPDAIGPSAHVMCHSPSYCTFQEMYDISLGAVTSFYRSCKNVTEGYKCVEDWTHLTCSGYCQGNFCTRNETGQHYKIHFG